jgi:DNA-binding response OmpR family regulator
MTNRFHILVVEDDALVADVLQTTLNSNTASVVPIASERLGRFCKAHIWTPCLIDCILPDGRSDEIIKLAEAVGTPVVEMSGYPPEMVGLKQRGHPHLQKPFGPATLLSLMDRVLGRQPAALAASTCRRASGKSSFLRPLTRESPDPSAQSSSASTRFSMNPRTRSRITASIGSNQAAG